MKGRRLARAGALGATLALPGCATTSSTAGADVCPAYPNPVPPDQRVPGR